MSHESWREIVASGIPLVGLLVLWAILTWYGEKTGQYDDE